MFARRLAIQLVLTLVASFTQPAHAFFDPPWITPAHPTVGETVSINIRGGVCDAIFGEDGYPQITQEGNAIRMRWYGQHWPEGSGVLLCSFPIGTLVAPLGAYPAGSYTLTVELAYLDFFGVPSIYTIGVVPFTVAGTPTPVAAPVPAIDAAGGTALLLLMLGLGVRALRSQRVV